MSITRIELTNYRAFPGPVSDIFDLTVDGGRGCNLLLYGENGSGKSSLARATAQLLDIRPDANAPRFADCLYSFHTPPLSEGSVILHFDQKDGATVENPNPHPLAWTFSAGRNRSHPYFRDMARTRGVLGYRDLQKIIEVAGTINRGIYNFRLDLFPLAVETLLVGIELPAQTSTFGDEWVEILRLKDLHPTHGSNQGRWDVSALQKRCGDFTASLRAFLPEIQNTANDLLARFVPWTRLELRLDGDAQYSKSGRRWRFQTPRLDLRLWFREKAIDSPSDFLNESRLSACALSIFLAALLRHTPPRKADLLNFPRLLVLDDVLISLDMAHRRPLLKMLEQSFEDWQVILLTHERAWYEVAKQKMRSAPWKHLELYVVRAGDYERPIVITDKKHLDRALDFLSRGEVKAAAVHVRTQFEIVLRWACEALKVLVPFNSDPHALTLRDLFSGLTNQVIEFQPADAVFVNGAGKVIEKRTPLDWAPVIPPSLYDRLEHNLSWVLNPLSHSETVERYRLEVEDAIFAVDELEKTVERALRRDFPQQLREREKLMRLIIWKAK
jgi:energy-coupling factor transporter ATP-binding protein EcfA2